MRLREDDVPEVHEESFRYSGPKPQTKESAIVSLADAIESASRSVEKPTPQKIETLVHEIIEERISDRQLDDCDLTLGELKTIADRFRFTLLSMLHTRIAYPKSGPKQVAPREYLRTGVLWLAREHHPYSTATVTTMPPVSVPETSTCPVISVYAA